MTDSKKNINRCKKSSKTAQTGRFLCMLLVLGLIPGCFSSTTPYTYVRKNYEQPAVKKVAILPFYNNTKIARASKIVTGAFIANLVEMKRFKVEFSGNIRNFLINRRIIVRTGVDLDTIKLMGKRLGIDAVILGQIEEFTEMNGKKEGATPVVSISSRMVDTRTGKILWMAQYRKTGDNYTKILDFGKVRSASKLTGKMISEMIKTMP